MHSPARNDHPIHQIIRDRRSPYQFADRMVESEKLLSLFEAARWSASSSNEQPWRYLIATREQPAEHQRMLGCLVEANQKWAKFLPVLMLSFAKRTFIKNGNPNRTAAHDLGAASAQMALQATSLGLQLHQMAGIDIEKIVREYNIPADYEPVAAVVVGYPAPNPDLDPAYANRDTKERTRKPLTELVFSGAWEKPAALLKNH